MAVFGGGEKGKGLGQGISMASLNKQRIQSTKILYLLSSLKLAFRSYKIREVVWF